MLGGVSLVLLVENASFTEAVNNIVSCIGEDVDFLGLERLKRFDKRNGLIGARSDGLRTAV